MYIYIEIIYTHLYTRSAKICLGALHFHYDQGGDLLTLHPNLQTFQGRDDAGLATADDGNIQRILFFVKIYRIYVKYKKGLCWDLKMDIIACPDIYNHMYIIYIYILQKQQNSKFHQYWGLVSCKPQISGVNSKSRLVMGGLQS